MPEEPSGSLGPPRVDVEDPGAHDLETSDSEDHFSDAPTQQDDQSTLGPPVPITRIEKVDSKPSHGEVPGTLAHAMRTKDAQPDEIAVIPNDDDNAGKGAELSQESTPGGQPIPITVVEKIDPSAPSHGEVPGTDAYDLRKTDAVPDVVLKAPEDSGSRSPSQTRSRAGSTPGDLPIPTTKVEKVDSTPSHGEVPGTDAYNMRLKDAAPDVVENVGDAPGTPTSSVRSSAVTHTRRRSSTARLASSRPSVTSLPHINTLEYNEEEDGGDAEEAGDDFDDFEEGEDAEFGDFDDGFQETEAAVPSSIHQLSNSTSPYPALNFEDLTTKEDFLAATDAYMDALFPMENESPVSLQSPSTPNSVFLTQRSASLWSQLVAPPPLQPPDWIRSRIRRIFLVSLGVPVDLDEILPASKQKKLVLPSMQTSQSPRGASSISQLKQSEANSSTTSVDSQGRPSSSKRRKGPPPVPELDLLYARQMCNITDEALNGLTPAELRTHVAKLRQMEVTANEVLEYWTKRTDEKLGDREAFEGVIENLVKHARKVRK